MCSLRMLFEFSSLQRGKGKVSSVDGHLKRRGLYVPSEVSRELKDFCDDVLQDGGEVDWCMKREGSREGEKSARDDDSQRRQTRT